MSSEIELIKVDSQEGFFFAMKQFNHEQIVYCYDKHVSLKAIIAIHSTVLGPALGGVRMWNYASESEALTDVLRLSRGMTFKAAISGLNLGGGKAVIIGDANTIKTEALLKSFGKFIHGLGGKYITACDVNMDTPDMQCIHTETPYVTGLTKPMGGGGSPAPATAYGTYLGIKASAKKIYGTENLKGKKIGVQGVGHVGAYLIEYLVKEGAHITITDISSTKIKKILKQFDVNTVEEHEIYDVAMDIYAPCALGATLNDNTIPRLKCSIVVGSANNQLKDEIRHSQMLVDKNILYAPDFLINAGGLINVYYEYLGGYKKEKSYNKIETIYNICLRVFSLAEETGITNHEAAMQLASKRIKAS